MPSIVTETYEQSTDFYNGEFKNCKNEGIFSRADRPRVIARNSLFEKIQPGQSIEY